MNKDGNPTAYQKEEDGSHTTNEKLFRTVERWIVMFKRVAEVVLGEHYFSG